MFLKEQMLASIYELQPEFRSEPEPLEAYIWSPVSCRHTSWTYEPLCRCDERGNIVKGSRRRSPFIFIC